MKHRNEFDSDEEYSKYMKKYLINTTIPIIVILGIVFIVSIK